MLRQSIRDESEGGRPGHFYLLFAGGEGEQEGSQGHMEEAASAAQQQRATSSRTAEQNVPKGEPHPAWKPDLNQCIMSRLRVWPP